MTIDIQTVNVPAGIVREQAELVLVAYGADSDEAAIQADARLLRRIEGRRARARLQPGLASWRDRATQDATTSG